MTIGIDGPAWLSDLNWAMPAVDPCQRLARRGYPMVILLAGLQAIPDSHYDAGKVDGPHARQRFRDITSRC